MAYTSAFFALVVLLLALRIGGIPRNMYIPFSDLFLFRFFSFLFLFCRFVLKFRFLMLLLVGQWLMIAWTCSSDASISMDGRFPRPSNRRKKGATAKFNVAIPMSHVCFRSIFQPMLSSRCWWPESWTARGHVPRGWLQELRLLKLKKNWHCIRNILNAFSVVDVNVGISLFNTIKLFKSLSSILWSFGCKCFQAEANFNSGT